MRSPYLTYIFKAAMPLVASSLMLVQGCDLFGGDTVVQPPPTEPTQPPVDPVANQAKPEETEKDSSYKRPDFPKGFRRDPFNFQPPQPEVQDEKQVREREPLEAFDLAQLKLVAIVTGTAVPNAMFVDPSGFGHFAKEDDRIGRDGGRISDIRTNEVEVTINPDGGVGSTADLEDPQDDGRLPAEPVTVLIRLSDTEIPAPSEKDEEEGSILDKIEEQKRQEKEGDNAPSPPLAP